MQPCSLQEAEKARLRILEVVDDPGARYPGEPSPFLQPGEIDQRLKLGLAAFRLPLGRALTGRTGDNPAAKRLRIPSSPLPR